ncbi:FXSXX-COOH protein [Planotetraspora sp. GP83]
MNTTEDTSAQIASEVRDLQHVPLAQMKTYGDVELGATLRRLMPASPDVTRVAVAAFNSSI